MYAFDPGPRRVDGCKGLPDEQTVRAIRTDEKERPKADAEGAVIEVKKNVYSFIQGLRLDCQVRGYRTVN
jgi:hypothetical protein